jgi:hypothetical protein
MLLPENSPSFRAKSTAFPLVHLYSEFLFVLSRQFIVLRKSPPTVDNDAGKGLRSLLADYRDDDHCVLIETIDDRPCRSFVRNSQFVAPRSNPRHPPRVWQA